MPPPQIPTPELVRCYVEKFDSGRSGLADKALAELFSTFSGNTQLEHVLLKVVTLNTFYNTFIWNASLVAEHICRLNIDPELALGSPELVNKIAPTPAKLGKSRRNFSFASKYCSWHVPDRYPVFDSIVADLIHKYRSVEKFSEFFWKKDLSADYVTFKQVIENFRDYYRLTEFNFKDLDKFLWLYGKEYFGKP